MSSIQQVTVVTIPATSTPLSATVSSSGTSLTFTPQLGRDMYITLSGTWTGSVQVQRSTDGGTNWNDITIGGGNPWGHYTTNCDEVVDTPTDGYATYRLEITIATGNLTYRLAQ